jgi:hypothetical protein
LVNGLTACLAATLFFSKPALGEIGEVANQELAAEDGSEGLIDRSPASQKPDTSRLSWAAILAERQPGLGFALTF